MAKFVKLVVFRVTSEDDKLLVRAAVRNRTTKSGFIRSVIREALNDDMGRAAGVKSLAGAGQQQRGQDGT